jgi:hypothetical protein
MAAPIKAWENWGTGLRNTQGAMFSPCEGIVPGNASPLNGASQKIARVKLYNSRFFLAIVEKNGGWWAAANSKRAR